MRAQEINPAKLAMLFRKEFQMCNVKKGETFLEENRVINSGLKTSRRKSLRLLDLLDNFFNNILAESIPIPYPGCRTEESAGVK